MSIFAPTKCRCRRFNQYSYLARAKIGALCRIYYTICGLLFSGQGFIAPLLATPPPKKAQGYKAPRCEK
jgi:hypothetical protein